MEIKIKKGTWKLIKLISFISIGLIFVISIFLGITGIKKNLSQNEGGIVNIKHEEVKPVIQDQPKVSDSGSNLTDDPMNNLAQTFAGMMPFTMFILIGTAILPILVRAFTRGMDI